MTTFKKITSLMIALSLVLTMGLSVFAGGTVTGLSASISGNSVTVSGTTSNVKAAVFVQLCDGDSVLATATIDTDSNGNFTGVLTPDSDTALDCSKSYTVRAADTDGSNWVTTTPDVVAAVNGYSIWLDGYIRVNYHIRLDSSLKKTDTAVTFNLDSQVNDLKTQTVTWSEDLKDGDDYVFSCKLAAAEMTLPITANITNGDLIIPLKTVTARDIIRTYVNDNEEDKTSNLAKSLLNYGYYAQVKFNAGGDRFEEDKLTLVNPGRDRIDRLPDITGMTYYASSVSFLSGFMIKHYYTVTGTNASFKIGDGEEQSLVPNGNYRCAVTGENSILAANDSITITITCDGASATYSYSSLDYIAAVLANTTAKQDMKDLAMAYYMYYQAAAEMQTQPGN